MKVLLAEDGEVYARILTTIFQRQKLEVVHVSSGLEAYELIKSGFCPDLLVTDVMMPGMTGFELLARLKEESMMPPTIVISGRQLDEDVLQGLSYGVLDYIVKPFSPSVVLAKVQSIVSRLGVSHAPTDTILEKSA